ncbi:hypothetical protein SAMN04487967_0719 [Natronorubrum sediminis]|uniref:Uncharacterized protein n=1 Tax=Natronorubrum sediminis TaxID=640943 RepID=A0A1H6FPF9_9EURY|nr:hypothetical protein [Natronorubrum sediminis]SEH12242.1 hypothetical protein SAMN04487967_0719 [Natronorubrum sediminis]
MRRKSNATERGQAYTLEGFISAMVVLVAILLALQSVVITPTTGGAADRTVQAQMQQEAQDALVVAAEDTDNNSLSEMVRYWDGDGGFEGTDDSLVDPHGNNVYSPGNFSNESELGEILYDRFDERGQNYNVELHYNNESDETKNRSLVYQGSPSSNAVSASYTVSLYDDQLVTDSSDSLSEASNPSIPDADSDDSLYNVVEVRVIVW